eukprot:s7431_g3.t1
MPLVAEKDEAGQDSLVNKVMDELEAVNLDAKSKPVTMPSVPGKPFWEREEELGTAMGSTGPESRVPRCQNKIGATAVCKPETEPEKVLRTLRSQLPSSTRAVSQIKLKSLSNRARMPNPVPEGEVFDPKHNAQQFNNKTATVITQMLMAIPEITTRECKKQYLAIDPKAEEWNDFRSKGGKTAAMWEILSDSGVQEIAENSSPADWHLWLQRETAVAAIQKMLQMMFSVQATNKDRFKNKHVLTYFHWFRASSALKWKYSQQDVNTGQRFSHTDFNSWIMPLLAARGEVSNNDPEVVQPESDDEEETEVVYHSNTVGFCPDWGVTADGFED